MGINSNQKGKVGEREFARWLRDTWGAVARRGRQYAGHPDAPDVVSDIPLHFEVKRTEKLRLYQALEQASDDSDSCPVVAHRQNNKPWVFILYADDFEEIANIFNDYIARKRRSD